MVLIGAGSMLALAPRDGLVLPDLLQPPQDSRKDSATPARGAEPPPPSESSGTPLHWPQGRCTRQHRSAGVQLPGQAGSRVHRASGSFTHRRSHPLSFRRLRADRVTWLDGTKRSPPNSVTGRIGIVQLVQRGSTPNQCHTSGQAVPTRRSRNASRAFGVWRLRRDRSGPP